MTKRIKYTLLVIAVLVAMVLTLGACAEVSNIPSDLDLSGLTFPKAEYIYDGEEHSLAVKGTLPEGVTVVYEGNAKTEVGSHTVTAKFYYENEYIKGVDLKSTLTIKPLSDLDLSGVILAGKTVEYDGKAHSATLDGTLPEGVTVEYLNNSQTAAGVHSVGAKFYYKGNYLEGKDKSATVTINKRDLTDEMYEVAFNSTTIIYTGNAYSIYIAGNLPDGVTVSYEGNGVSAVGTHTVTASFAVDTNNYVAIADKTATITIIEAPVGGGVTIPSDLDLSGITLAGDTVTYDGEEHSLAISGTLPADVTVIYLNNDKVNVGVHSVVAKFYYKGIYIAGEDREATLSITKKSVTLDGISFNSATVIYDGKAHSIAIEGTIPEGVRVVYTGNGQTEVGVYNVVASFVVDEDNYEVVIETYTATLVIENPEVKVSFTDAEFVYDGTAKQLALGGLAGLSPSVTFLGYVDGDGGDPVFTYTKTDAGVYTVTARFALGGEYDPSLDMTATLTIKKAQIKVSAPVTEFNFVFDGNKKLPEDVLVWDGDKPECVTVVAPAAQRLPGTYTLVYKFAVDNAVAKNYETKEISVTMTIVDNPTLATEGLKFGLMSNGNYYVSGYTGTDTAVIIPSTYEGAPVSAIAYGAFDGNTEIEYVRVPDSVIAIGQAAFRGCTSLEAITLPFIGGSHNSSNEYLGHIFGASGVGGNEQFVPESLKLVDISDACKRIPAYAFQYCRDIVEVRLGGAVTELGVSAFRGCTSLREVYIPASVTIIRPVAEVNSAFYECSSDITIYLEADTVPAAYTDAWCVINASGDKAKVVLGVAK